MEAISSQHGRSIEGDVFSGRNSRIAAGHILAHCGYGFRVHIGQYLTNQLLHCLPVYPWRSRGLRCFRAIHIVGHGVDQELCLAPTLLVQDRGYLLVAWVTGIELDGKDGTLTLDRDGSICNCTLKDGLITVNDYFGFDLQLTFRKSGGSGTAELSLDDFASVYGGDWHGMAGLSDATGDLEALNDTAHEILARLVFDGNGGCEVWLAMYLEGENDFNFANTYARVVPDDETGLELRGEFMGGEMQEGILSVDETGALYVSCEVDSDLVDGSISLLANLRHLDDENWTDDDFMPLPADAVEYYRGKTFMEIANTYEIDTSLIPDDGSGDAAVSLPSGGDNGGLPENYPYERTTTNGQGEYGKSNPDATGRADLPTMQKVRQELWDMGSAETSKLTYDDIKEMLGGEDGIPHTGMDEKSWNSEKHAYGWFNGEGDYYVLYFNVQDGNEYYTAATFSSSVRGDS